jgi:hypothetical protein
MNNITRPERHPAAQRHPAARRPAAALAGLLALAALAALALAGCGGGPSGSKGPNGLASQRPATVATTVTDALRRAPSVRVVAAVTSAKGDSTTSYDLLVTGQASQGTVTTDGRTAQIVKINDDTYLKASREYYVQNGQPAVAALLADRWVRVAAQQAAPYRYFSLNGLATTLGDYLGTLAAGPSATTYAGAPSVLVTGADGTKLWAASTGAPYPLRLDLAGGETGHLEFTAYGAAVTIRPPAGALEASRLG